MKNIILRTLARGICRLPEPVLRIIGGKPIEIDGQRLDTLTNFIVKHFTHEPGHFGTTEELRADIDEQGHWLSPPRNPNVKTTPITFDGPAGPIKCEIHRHKTLGPNAPVLVFYHGGGHVTGSLKSHREMCMQLAAEVGCAVVAVDHRLAPEHKFPIGINDCLAAYDAVVAQAAALGFDPDRITVGGDSAGGNAAAVVAQQRKAAAHPPKFQLLWVPWVDMSRQTRSYELFGSGFFLDKDMMEWCTDHYLRTPEDGTNPLASPIYGDVEGVCPATLLIAGFDVLRDEGIAYGEKLKQAGVKTDVRVMRDQVHLFINMAGYVPAARRAFDEAVQILRTNM